MKVKCGTEILHGRPGKTKGRTAVRQMRNCTGYCSVLHLHHQSEQVCEATPQVQGCGPLR